ncbi:MAG TPA: flagellar basal body P-ring formation chaperone FlgA [Chromobacteriaceae bacterium]|nr:flagellar basal body P-ring formation chaperone FlgA [Chromobacteriaceae bacterium]
MKRITQFLTIWFLACPVVQAAPGLTEQTKQVAHAYLKEVVRQQGLSGADFTIQVLPASRAATPCNQSYQLEPTDTRFLSRMRFTAYCPGNPQGTDIIVRADMSADVVTASRDIAAGQVITPDNLTVQKRHITNVMDILSRPGEVVGQSSRRLIRAGQPLQKRLLLTPELVKRGQSVRIVARDSGIEVTVPGEALQSGGAGAVIKVRNVRNGSSLSARVVEAGTVEPLEQASSPREPAHEDDEN